jgi:hypothetical protein
MTSPIAKTTNPLLIGLDLSVLKDADKAIKERVTASNLEPLPELILDDETKADLITFCEAWFWTDKRFPTKDEIKQRFDFTDRELVYYTSEIEEPLKNRTGQVLNLFPSPVKIEVPGFKLDPLFALAVTEILNVGDKKSNAAKLKAIGLTTRQWQALLAVPENRNYFKNRMNEVFGETTEFNAKLSIAKLVETGDLAGIKYYHEFTGLHKQGSETSLNLAFILGRVMEILAQYVSPEILGNIADQIDTVIEVKELESA